MTHDTPPKRIWACPPDIFDSMGFWQDQPHPYGTEYTLTSEADAMVAAALRVKPLQWKEYPNQGNWRADTPVGEYSVGFDDGWWAQLEGVEFWDWQTPEDPRSYSGPEAGMRACKADYEARILATLEDSIPAPASSALDKLIAEAVAAATPTMQRAARVLHDEAMAAAYLGENVTEDEAAMLQFIDALGGKTKVINALHALATATKGATP